MTDPKQRTAPELFRAAAALIEQALIQFDMREDHCLECGRKKFANFSHAIAYKQFGDTPRKLKDSADELDTHGFKPVTEIRRTR